MKMLQSMHHNAQTEEQLLNYQIEQLQKQRDSSKKKKEELEERLKPKALTVSEHAILRYLERIEQVDIERVRTILLDPQIIMCHKKLGNNGEYPSADNTFRVKVKNNVITTVLP